MLTVIPDAMLQDVCPIAQHVFNNFIWAAQVHYQLTFKERQWLSKSVSDQFVEDFSLPFQVCSKYIGTCKNSCILIFHRLDTRFGAN